MNRYDVVVVGGGPIGGFVAKKIASSGYNIALFEEHKKIGEPLKCAGLVTPRVFNYFDVHTKNAIQNKIFGAHVYSPSGNVLTIGGDKVHAFVINRSNFDEHIINNAKNNGAEIVLKAKIKTAKRWKNRILLDILHNGDNKLINCSLLIGADGSHSIIRKSFNFPAPKEFLYGIGANVKNVNINPKFVKIFLGADKAPGFFSWIIPLNKNGSAARIGLCVKASSKNSLKQCFAKLLQYKDLRDMKITKQIGGSIPLGALKKTTTSNVMLVGDAAAQVKPTSGGGLYTGILSATHCSSVALEALKCNDYRNQVLSKYHKLWSKQIGKELFLGMRFRAIFKTLDDKQFNYYIRKFNNKKTITIICKYGDIDYPSKLGIPLLKNTPSLLKLMPSIFK
jgi:geranylgeranyl reductase family protein